MDLSGIREKTLNIPAKPPVLSHVGQAQQECLRTKTLPMHSSGESNQLPFEGNPFEADLSFSEPALRLVQKHI